MADHSDNTHSVQRQEPPGINMTEHIKDTMAVVASDTTYTNVPFESEANEIKTAKKQHTVLLSVCGRTMYHLIRDRSYPQKPMELKFSQLVELVQRYKHP